MLTVALRSRQGPRHPPGIEGTPTAEPVIPFGSSLEGPTDERRTQRGIRLTLLIGGSMVMLLGCELLWSSGAAALRLFVAFWGAILLALGIDPRLAAARWLGIVARWLDVRPVQVVWLLVGIALTVAARSASGDLAWAAYSWYWLLWLGGIALTIAGCSRRRSLPHTRPRLSDLAVVIALAAFALAVRLPGLEYVPYVMRGDEGAGGLSGLTFLYGSWDNVLVAGWFQFPSLYFWIVSLAQSLLGRTAIAIRVVSALAGSAAVIAAYFWSRSMFGRLTGFLAAVLLASSDLHLVFSRVGLNNILDTLTLSLAMAVLWAAWKSGDRHAFLFLGIAVGLSQFFYATGRWVPVLVLASLLVMRLQTPGQPRTADVAAAGLVALSVCLPLALFYLDHPSVWLAPLARAAADRLGPVTLAAGAHRAGLTALGIVSQPMIGFYSPGTPMLVPALAVLFLGGVGVSLARWRDPRSAALLLGLGAVVLTGALSLDPPNSHRLLFATPVCAILCALPLGELSTFVQQRRPSLALTAAAAIVVLTLLLSALNLDRFFSEALPRHAYWDAHSEVGTRAGRHLATLPGPLRAFLLFDASMPSGTMGQLFYLAGEVDWVDLRDPVLGPQAIPSFAPPAVFLASPARFSELEFIQQSIPGGTMFDGIGDSGRPIYRALQFLP